MVMCVNLINSQIQKKKEKKKKRKKEKKKKRKKEKKKKRKKEKKQKNKQTNKQTKKKKKNNKGLTHKCIKLMLVRITTSIRRPHLVSPISQILQPNTHVQSII